MSSRHWLAVGLLLPAMWILCATAEPASSNNYALLIGIQNYDAPGVNPLDGPLNDIALVEELLQKRFRIPKENITTLLDTQATHTRIDQAFAQLAERVKPGDFIYIHYSGHGSEYPDKRDEHGNDQTWVSYGARSDKVSGIDYYDVLDKEIASWLASLYQKTKTDHIIFVSDSCHSATVSRGELRGVRSARSQWLLKRGDETDHPALQKPLAPEQFRTAKAPVIRIGAARDIESAIEITEADKIYGLFTWYWVEALNQTRPGETWDDVFKRTYALVTTERGVSQRPQMEGHGDWAVFGGHFEALKPTVAITKVDEPARTVEIAVGAVNGATPKSVYQLYQASAAGLGEPVPTIDLATIRPYTSRGTIKQGTFKVGDLVVEKEHAYPFAPIKVAVEGDYAKDQDKDLVQRIETMLKGLKGFERVGQRSQANWIAYVFRPVHSSSGGYVYKSEAHTLPRSSPDQTPEVWVISPQEKLLHDKMRIPLKDPERGIALLADNLSKFARVQEVKQLAASGAPPPVTVTAFLLQPAPGCEKDCVHLLDEKGDEQSYRKQPGQSLEALRSASFKGFKRGDILSFAVKNDGEDALYVYLLNIGPNGEIRVIFPAPEQAREHARVEAGESRDLSKEAGLLLNAPGTEMVKVLATSQPIDVRLFQAEGYREMQAQRGDSLNPLERLLAAAIYERGQEMFAPPKSWGTAQAEFPVTK